MVNNRHRGFTLIEVLVSLAVFAVGMLGIGLYLAKGMAASVDNQVHSSAMRVAKRAVEPLYLALRGDRDRFRNVLATYQAGNQSPLFSAGNAVDQAFDIALTQAEDAAGQPLLTTATANWQPPFQVVFTVSYQADDRPRQFPVAHVFVPPPRQGAS